MLSGCFGSGGAQTGTGTEPPNSASDTAVSSVSSGASDGTDAQSTSEVSGTAASAAALASESETGAAVSGDRPLVIAVRRLEKEYTPFGELTDDTALINKLTGVTLMSHTRSGAPVTAGTAAVTESFGGNIYAYSGIADTVKQHDPGSGTTAYTFLLRDDLRFSDGEALDADDVIFTMYLHLDPSYEGSCALHDADIVGAINYRYDSASAAGVTKEKIDAALASDEMRAVIKEKLMIPTLREQLRTVRTLYDDSSYSFYTSKYPKPAELFAYFYSINSEYSAKGKDENTVISDIADMYGSNYRLLASMTVGDETYFDDEALSLAVGYISGSTDSGSEHISSVSGIVKNGKNGITVTVNGDGSAFEKIASEMVILPLHVYGNEALYDYSAGSFGFEKGKADRITSSLPEKQVSAGAYTYVSSDDESVTLAANEYYYKGVPAAGSVRIIKSGYDDPAALIADGTADICAENVTSESFKTVDSANRSMEKIFASASTEPGYGYIGINADTVRIGDAFSDKSYALRKALATAISAFREASVKDYFGGYGILTDYPFIDDVTVEKTMDGYITPFNRTVDGDPVCNPDMTAEERRTAARSACLGFFREAGYTITDGVVSSAPSGGKMTFTAMIAADGKGDHPSYYALSCAAEILSDIGITLEINDISDASELWDSLNSGTNEIWAGAWTNESLRKVYVDSYYGADSTKLKNFISDAEDAAYEDKPAAYLKCYNKVVNEYAAEIPMYRRANYTLFSALRIDISSIPADMTEYYSWADEISSIRIKQ